MSKISPTSCFQLLLALLTVTYFSHLGWFHTGYAASLGTIPCLWYFQHLQHHPSFTFTASGNGLSGLPCKELPLHIPLDSVVLLSHRGRFHDHNHFFFVVMTLKPEPCVLSCHIAASLLVVRVSPSINICISFNFDGFLYCWSFPLIPSPKL